MKVVIPTDDKDGLASTVAQHFGRCSTYTFLDSQTGEVIDVIDNTSEHMGGKGLPPEIMKEHGADILLCKSLGPRAITLCKKLGIAVYVGEADTAEEMFKHWKEDKVKQAGAEDACRH